MHIQQNTYFMAWVENGGNHDDHGLYSTYAGALEFIQERFYPEGCEGLIGLEGPNSDQPPTQTDTGLILQCFSAHGEAPTGKYPDNMLGVIVEAGVRT